MKSLIRLGRELSCFSVSLLGDEALILQSNGSNKARKGGVFVIACYSHCSPANRKLVGADSGLVQLGAVVIPGSLYCIK